uniref:Major facilitator superfamily (MFS) profile domain-containing protein n=1 Tax=Musca domestica TaxID=7370 RepID=A0A1I8N4L7_MUSDO
MVQCRTVLWHVVFVGFIINYLICINLNITIVDMVVVPPSRYTTNDLNLPSKELTNDSLTHGKSNVINATNNVTIENQISDLYVSENHTIPENLKKFHWNEREQALALGSFFWTHWITQIPGGILSRRYGTKLVFGLSNVISCWICFLIPYACFLDFNALLVARMLQGLLTGLSWPAMHNMTAKWIPPNERSKFITAYFGSAVGLALAYPLFACVIHWASWIWVFHITGIVGTIWWFAWLYFVYDTPAEHPRISRKELQHIQSALGNAIQSGHNLKTPWLAIFTSRPVWMNVIGQWAGAWSIFTVMTQAPTYFKIIHNWDIRATGVFSGFPHILRMFFAYSFSLFADYLLRNNKMSRTNVRKLATGICCIPNAIMMAALAFFGTNRILAITFISLAITFQGSGTSGPLSSMVDIAPNFAGIISGICGTIGSMPGFISAYIVGVVTFNNQTFEAWRNVFLITAGVLFLCGTLYLLFADSSLQPWNDGYSQSVECGKHDNDFEAEESSTIENNTLMDKSIGKNN